MKKGICHLSVIPVRKEPSDKSEMSTQVLFGEMIEVLQTHNNWSHIRIFNDKYEGWIDTRQYFPLSEEQFFKLNENEPLITLDLVQVIQKNDLMFPILLGSSIPYLTNNSFYIANVKYFFEGMVTNNQKQDKKKIIENAYMYLNSPYLWGGKTPFGVDCSGFTQMVYRLSGLKIPRDSSQQAEEGEIINFIDEAEPGDLVFFENREKEIIHVGILLENNKIIHASGRVKIDVIDHQGIFDLDKKEYSHKLRLIKKYK